MTIEQALRDLGVHENTLTKAEKESLDRDGFVFLHGIVTREQAARMLGEIHRLFEVNHVGEPGAPSEVQQIQNMSGAFDVCVTHPRVIAAIYHVLRADFVSQGVHSRPNPPGKGKQGMHQDGPPCADGVFQFCNSMWPLVDFTAENGATRVVPGSHRFGKAPNELMKNVEDPYPGEVQLVMPVGSVGIFNGSTWHSAVLNRSHADRPNVTSFWGLRSNKAFDATLSESAKNRMSAAVQRLFPEMRVPAM